MGSSGQGNPSSFTLLVFVDAVSILFPPVGLARGIAEAINGTNVSDKAPLTPFEIGLGLATLGKGRGALPIFNALEKGQAGRFADLIGRGVKGENLTPHHMPQAALGLTNRLDGGALVLSGTEHQLTRTYGFKGALIVQQETGLAFRDVLARDIRDVRNIAGSQYNQGISDLLNYYRTNFPGLILKR